MQGASSIYLSFLNQKAGKPMQNGYIERFNWLYREAVLGAYLFFDLYQVKQKTEVWIIKYHER